MRDGALKGHVDAFLESDDLLVPSDFIGANAVKMEPVLSAWPDFGYTSDRVWLRLRLINKTDTSMLRVHFRENFMQEFAVFAIHADGTLETLYELGRDSPFSARAILYPEMIAPLRLIPGGEATVMIRYRSDGASHLAFAVETLESFAEITTVRTAKGYIFYGMVLLLIAVAFISLAWFRRPIFAAYAAYTTASLLYIMHADGVAFQMLWPNWPGFNSMATVVTGSGIIVFGAIYARVFVETKEKHPILDKLLLAVITITLALDVILWTTNPQLLKKLLVIFSMLAIILFAITGLVAARTRFREVRFYVVAWLGVVISAAVLNARHILGLEISQDAQYDSMRAALVFDAIMMGLAIADRYDMLRRTRKAAMDTALQQAQENAKLAGRVAHLGARYEEARALARGRGDILEDTVHDLRQPMSGMRLALNNLDVNNPKTAKRRPEDLRRFEASLNYMEGLIEERIAASTAQTPVMGYTLAEPRPPGLSGVHSVLQSVQAMFAPEADAKGLELRLKLGASDREIHSFALMRVLSNLVSNAVKFTDSGKILIALRAGPGGMRIEVHDTGPGLEPEDFAAAKSRHVRLSAEASGAEGSGLGLAIASSIAQEEGWSLDISQTRQNGTGLILHMPAGAT